LAIRAHLDRRSWQFPAAIFGQALTFRFVELLGALQTSTWRSKLQQRYVLA
jgi:hypothetical protein